MVPKVNGQFMSFDEFIRRVDSVGTDRIDVTKLGYSSKEKFKEAMDNLHKNYLNNSTKTPQINNSEDAGGYLRGVELDPIGFPIFRSPALKDEVNLVGKYSKDQLLNMSRSQHLSAATKLYKETLENAAKLKATREGVAYTDSYFDNYLKSLGFVDEDSYDQIQAIKNGAEKIPGYTWHHHPETGRLQLVATSVHGKMGHTGGNQIWGNGK